MNPDERQLLERTNKLAEENNKILKSLRTAHRWSAFFNFIYWVVIIGVAVGAFYFLQPYVNTLLKAYSSIQSDLGGVKSVVSPAK